MRQANWRRGRGESPMERRMSQSTIHREPCSDTREGVGEASVAARVGRVWSGRGGLILWILWITPLTGLCSRSSSALGTRNCHLLPMSATPPAVRAPRPRGRGLRRRPTVQCRMRGYHIVRTTTATVHRTAHARCLQQPREHDTGELAPLIGVEDLQRSVALQTPGDAMSWFGVAAVDRHARQPLGPPSPSATLRRPPG